MPAPKPSIESSFHELVQPCLQSSLRGHDQLAQLAHRTTSTAALRYVMNVIAQQRGSFRYARRELAATQYRQIRQIVADRGSGPSIERQAGEELFEDQKLIAHALEHVLHTEVLGAQLERF